MPSVPGLPWLEWLAQSPYARLNLFCFHHAGGGATAYRSWPAALPGVGVCAVDMPGRSRLVAYPPFTHIEPLIEALTEVMLPELQRKPFVFFGHSMGALVAYELSRALRRTAGVLPEVLIVSGRRAPCYPPHTAFHTYSDEAFVERLKRLNGTPAEVWQHPELLQLILPTLRADFAVCETYQHQPQEPLSCPIIAVGGTEDPDVAFEHLAGWQRETSASCDVRMFAGDHFYLRSAQAPLLNSVAHVLRPRPQPLEYAL